MCNTTATPRRRRGASGSRQRLASRRPTPLPPGVSAPHLHLAPPDVHPGDGRPLVHVGPEVDVPDSRGAVHHVRDVHRSEEHTSELQSRLHLVCRLLLEKKKKKKKPCV